MAKRRSGARGKRPFLVPLVAAGVVAVGIVGNSIRSAASVGDMAVAPVELPGIDADPQGLVSLARGVTLGDPDAPITILEFADFSCPHCAQFAQSIKPRIELAYLQEGRAKIVFHDFPLGSFPHSFLAARAARCAGDQERYWEYHDTLFRNQTEWSFASAPPAARLVGYAEELGLEAEAFETCLRSDRHADVVTANERLARELNLRSTPSILIGSSEQRLPRPVEVISFEAIAAAIEAVPTGG